MTAEQRIRLTPRQREMVQLILDGCSNREIADRLAVKEQTVRNALSAIYLKFEVKSRLALAREASRRKW